MSLRPGKLPAAMLADLLASVSHADPRVLLGPGIGRDAAVIDIGNGRVLVAKTDPVTFAAEDIGWYAVHVNANDIACMGARPAWMLATALLPPGASDDLPSHILAQLSQACDALAIELVGGHTEVTLGLDRPILVGAMLGEADRDNILLGQNATPGDDILLTKEIAIEGTALLARESKQELDRRGVAADVIERAKHMLYVPGISVVLDAQTLCANARPRIMHDPTEGGVATALEELAQAANVGIAIDSAAIPILAETRAICEALSLDPLGLLASGALLAIVPAATSGDAIRALADVKISCIRIGSVVSGPPRVIMGAEDSAVPLPRFERDELARFYDEAQGEDRGMTPRAEGK